MKEAACIFLLCTFVFLCAFVGVNLARGRFQPASFEPKALSSTSLEENNVSLGFMRAGETKVVDIVFRNNAHEPVSIINVSTTCGCTKVDRPSSSISAGESVNLSTSFEAPHVFGETTAKIGVATSDGTNSEYTLVGFVLTQDIGTLDFGTFKRGENIEKALKVANPPTFPFHIKIASVDTSILDVRIDQDSDTRIIVHPHEQIPYGPVVQTVKLATDFPQQPMLELKILGHVQEPIVVEDERVAVGKLGASEEKSVETAFYSPYEEKIEILDVTSDREDWAVRRTSPQVLKLQMTISGKDRETDAAVLRKVYTVTAATVSGFKKTFDIELLGLALN